jgi:hypothetical protein
MSVDAPETLIKASEVQVGDRIRAANGTELTVTRIDDGFMGRPGMVAFVEDSADQWFKMPSLLDGEIPLIARGGGA